MTDTAEKNTTAGTWWIVENTEGYDRHYIAHDEADARAQFAAERPDETPGHVWAGRLEDAPWTTDRSSPTDDPAYWRADEPCDYDLGVDRTCHHPVHAFGEPKPLRHLIDAASAMTAAKYGWWA